MKKEKIINFIDLLISNNIISDRISKENYQLIKKIIGTNELFQIKDFKYIVKKSSDIITKMYTNFNLYNESNFKKINITPTNYQQIRKDLHYYPSYDENKALEIINISKKINNRFDYELHIDTIKINLFFYCENEDINLFNNLAHIIFLFVKTFGINKDKFNNYNIRFLLIDFPRELKSDNFKENSERGFFNNSSGVHIMSKKELVVSRKNGITGLLIHELIHMLGLDFCYNFKDNTQVNINNWNNKWIENNNVIKENNNIISFIESICNTNSSYFLALFNSIFICNKLNQPNNLIKYFKYFYYIEYLYCFVNGSKLLSFFGFNNYDSFFNNITNRKFYQNALVFEYIIIRIFMIFDFYQLVMKYFLKCDFNKETSDSYNKNYQTELNNKLINMVEKKYIKNIFDNISKIVIIDKPKSIEYFSLDLILN